MRVLKAEAGREGGLGDGALAGCEDLGHFAEDEPEGEGRDRAEGRAVEEAGEGAGEFGVADGGRGDGVQRGVQVGGSQRPEDEGDGVIDVDPGHPLAAAGEGTGDAELESGQHAGQRAATAAEDHAEAEADDAESQGAGQGGGLFPSDAGIGEEAAAGRSGFVEHLVAAIAVIAGCGGADEGPGPRGEGGEGLDEALGAEDAAVADARAGLGGPTLGDGFAGEVDDGVGGGQAGGGGLAGEGVPGEGAGAGRGTAAEENEIVALAGEGGREGGAEEAGGAGQSDAHGSREGSSRVSPSWAISRR